MITQRQRAHALKIGLLLVWALAIASVYLYLDAHHVSLRQIPHFLRFEVMRAGAWGPLVVLVAYLAVTIIPFPTAALAVISGAVYGPIFGSVLVLLGLNAASVVSFYLGRFFGRHFVDEHEHGWVKKYDELMQEQGLIAVMVMRMLFFPFDVVSIGSGMTKMSLRQYMIGTFLGSLPGTVTFVVLGGAFTDPRTWILFSVLLALSLAMVYFIRRSQWAQKRIFKKVEPKKFE